MKPLYNEEIDLNMQKALTVDELIYILEQYKKQGISGDTEVLAKNTLSENEDLLYFEQVNIANDGKNTYIEMIGL